MSRLTHLSSATLLAALAMHERAAEAETVSPANVARVFDEQETAAEPVPFFDVPNISESKWSSEPLSREEATEILQEMETSFEPERFACPPRRAAADRTPPPRLQSSYIPTPKPRSKRGQRRKEWRKR